MPRNSYRDQMLLPFDPVELFKIVVDIEKYPEFIPWCKQVTVLLRQQNEITAKVEIKFKAVKAEYTCKIECKAPDKQNSGFVKVNSTDGSFEYLYNSWELIPKENNSCLINFYIEYELKSRILQLLVSLAYKKAQMKIISAFKERAYKILK